jgi:hypothetical protein
MSKMNNVETIKVLSKVLMEELGKEFPDKGDKLAYTRGYIPSMIESIAMRLGDVAAEEIAQEILNRIKYFQDKADKA